MEFSFPLTTTIVHTETPVRTVPVLAYSTGAAGGNNLGWNLIGQPYLSKFTGINVGVNYMTFYNASGTYDQYTNTAISSINPFSAYFVQAAADASISFALVGRQSVPNAVATDTSDRIQINIKTSTGIDNTNLIIDEVQSPAYQIGQDLEKWLGVGTSKPQIYTTLGNVNFAYNALPIETVQQMALGLYSNTEGPATISVDASQVARLSGLLLTDKSTGLSTDLLNSDYSFTIERGINNSRFSISAQRAVTQIPTDVTLSEMPVLSTLNYKMKVDRLFGTNATVRVFNSTGTLVAQKVTYNTSLEITLPAEGVYVV